MNTTGIATIVMLAMTLSPFGAPVREGVQPADVQQRLAELELEYNFSSIRWHVPKLNMQKKELEAEIKLLSGLPGVRSRHYRQAVQRRKKAVEAEIAKLHAGGAGKKHPTVLMRMEKIKVIDSLLKKGS